MSKQLVTLDIVAPGRLGLNRESRGRVLPPGFVTKATNFRLDRQGLLASRAGQTDSTGTAIGSSPNVETLFEYKDASGTVENIVAWDGGIANSIDDPAGNDISGSLTDTNGTWWMQNFNDKCLAFQSGQKLAVYSGSTFATVVESSGTAPSSGIAGVAFGRVWQVDNSDGANLKYTALLDETDWGGAGAGSIDFSNIWTNGQDRITAIVGFNATLVVFGVNHIVFIIDGSNSELGLNPSNAYVVDVIGGTGCVDQQTVQMIGDSDVLYLSQNGVQSLQRVTQERSNPLTSVSKNVRTELLEAYRAATAGTIRSAYNPDNGIYILTFPAARTYVFDTRWMYQDAQGDMVAPVFEWDLLPTAWVSKENGTLLMGGAGEVFTYSGTTDNGTAISLTYESPWLDFGEDIANRLKILKKIGAIVFTNHNGNMVFKWGTDFITTFDSYTKEFIAQASSGDEWGVAEWNIGEWGGGGSTQKIFKVPARGTGQYFRIQMTVDLSVALSLQQLELQAKIGRLA